MDQNKNIAFQGKSEYHAFGPFWGSRLGRGGFWQAANNTEAVCVIPLFAAFQPMAFSPSFDITFKLCKQTQPDFDYNINPNSNRTY